MRCSAESRLPSPNNLTLARLRHLVVEKGFDIGIGTDGDADRLGIIDEKGDFIHPNDILALLYYYLLKHKGWKGGVVRNLATTHLLDRIAEGFENALRGPCRFQAHQLENGGDEGTDRRGVERRTDDSRPHPGQGWGIRRQPADRVAVSPDKTRPDFWRKSTNDLETSHCGMGLPLRP